MVIWALDGQKPLRLAHAFNSDSAGATTGPLVMKGAGRQKATSIDLSSGNKLLLDIAAANSDFMRAWASGGESIY